MGVTVTKSREGRAAQLDKGTLGQVEQDISKFSGSLSTNIEAIERFKRRAEGLEPVLEARSKEANEESFAARFQEATADISRVSAIRVLSQRIDEDSRTAESLENGVKDLLSRKALTRSNLSINARQIKEAKHSLADKEIWKDAVERGDAEAGEAEKAGKPLTDEEKQERLNVTFREAKSKTESKLKDLGNIRTNQQQELSDTESSIASSKDRINNLRTEISTATEGIHSLQIERESARKRLAALESRCEKLEETVKANKESRASLESLSGLLKDMRSAFNNGTEDTANKGVKEGIDDGKAFADTYFTMGEDAWKDKLYHLMNKAAGEIKSRYALFGPFIALSYKISNSMPGNVGTLKDVSYSLERIIQSMETYGSENQRSTNPSLLQAAMYKSGQAVLDNISSTEGSVRAQTRSLVSKKSRILETMAECGRAYGFLKLGADALSTAETKGSLLSAAESMQAAKHKKYQVLTEAEKEQLKEVDRIKKTLNNTADEKWIKSAKAYIKDMHNGWASGTFGDAQYKKIAASLEKKGMNTRDVLEIWNEINKEWLKKAGTLLGDSDAAELSELSDYINKTEGGTDERFAHLIFLSRRQAALFASKNNIKLIGPKEEKLSSINSEYAGVADTDEDPELAKLMKYGGGSPSLWTALYARIGRKYRKGMQAAASESATNQSKASAGQSKSSGGPMGAEPKS